MTLAEMKEDYDWQQAFLYAESMVHETPGSGPPPVEAKLSAVEEAFIVPGENDGESWLALFRIGNSWFSLAAWCDYTGWDCQAGGSCWYARSLDDAIMYGFTAEERTRMMNAECVK